MLVGIDDCVCEVFMWQITRVTIYTFNCIEAFLNITVYFCHTQIPSTKSFNSMYDEKFDKEL